MLYYEINDQHYQTMEEALEEIRVYNENTEDNQLTEDNITEVYYCEDCDTFVEEDEYDTEHERCNECESNYIECYHCGDHVHNDDVYEAHGDYYCNDCYNDNFTSCNACGDTIHNDDARWNENDEEYYCDSCYEDDSNIMGYHDYDDWTNKGQDNHYTANGDYIVRHYKDTLRFGFELEVEMGERSTTRPNECAGEVLTATNGNITYDNVVIEHDGSLDNGFEIISQPMTMEYYKSRKQYFTNMLQTLRNERYVSHDKGTCGLHVHITRNALGKDDDHINTTINNIIMLMETFKDELTIFSRRKQRSLDRWAQFITTATSFEGDILTYKYIDDKKGDVGRYMALNTTSSRTIEFRLWRGTLNEDTFNATLELTLNIVEYCRTHADIRGLTWKQLIDTSDTLRAYNTLRDITSYKRGNNLLVYKKHETIDTVEYTEGE